MRAAPKQAGEKGEDGQRIFPSFSSHGISGFSIFMQNMPKIGESGHLELQVIK